jgi:type VI secretion system secreted protein VgrG
VGGDSGDEDEDDELRGARVGPERAEYEHDSAPLTLAGFDGRYRENDADAQVRIRRERQRCEALVVEGEATAIGLAPGRIFEVAGHPRPGHDRRWLVRAATHRASARSWSTRFECIPAEVPHRPRRAAARPRISGVQTARVVGPAGEEIHTDEHGRIKVQFHWDRDGRLDERSSCWIHVAQPWAGAGWGFVFVPRIGMEVIVTFVNGDADRPICTGCVYNGENRPPLALPDEKTRSTIRTSSSLGGDGYNELTFEDAAGEEQIIVHAQRDLNETVERAHTTVVGGDQSNSVSGDHSNSVDGEHTEYVGGNQSLTVEGDRQVVVSGLQDFTVEGGNSSHLVTGGSYVLETSDEVTVIAPTRITLRCGSSEIVMTPNRIELCAGGCASLVLDDSVLARSCAGATALLNDDVTAFSNQDARLLLAAAALLCESSQASQLVLADDGAVLNGAGGASVQLTAAMNATSAAGSVVELNDAALLQGASGGSCCLTADCRLESAGGGTVVVAGPVVELNG